MCLICRDWVKGIITTKEAWRNLNEMADDPNKTEEDKNHKWEVAEMLIKDKNETDER